MGDDRGENDTDGEEQEPPPFPDRLEPCELHEEIGDIRGAVGDIGEDCEKEEAEQKVEGEGLLRAGESEKELKQYDEKERQVVNQPHRLPEFERSGGMATQSVEKATAGAAAGLPGIAAHRFAAERGVRLS